MTPIIGFAPDIDKGTPGVLASCVNLIPYLNGMEGGPAPVTPPSVPALESPCRGAVVARMLDDTRRLIAGTSTKLFELVSGAWVDRSRVGGYAAAAGARWSFTQFGNATLASTGYEPIQRSESGAFADIAGAPKAQILFSVGSFVMALNTDDGVAKPDGWHCCAVFDDTDWTPSLTTQAASGRLVATPGRLTAGARLGNYAVAFKERSMYLGQYVGPPVVWDWSQVADYGAGCVGKDALCDIGGGLFFVGPDNFWIFDGASPQPLADGVLRQWFAINANAEYLYKTVCTYDRTNSRVWVFYPSAGSTECDAVLVYHVLSKRWGRAEHAIQCALAYISPAATYDTWDAFGASYDDLPSVGFDSPLFLAGINSQAFFNTSNQLQTLSGDSVSSGMTTGEVGDDDAVMMLQQIRLRYALAPQSANVQTQHMANSGGDWTMGVTGVMNDGKFDTLKSSRWHRATVSFTGPVRVTHMNAKMKQAGNR